MNVKALTRVHFAQHQYPAISNFFGARIRQEKFGCAVRFDGNIFNSFIGTSSSIAVRGNLVV